jgi:hypothetical protein
MTYSNSNRILEWSSIKIDIAKFKSQLQKLEDVCVSALENKEKSTQYNSEHMTLINAILSKVF